MLDKTIHKHIDEIDNLEDKLNERLTQAYDKLDVEEIIESPKEVLFEFVDVIKELLMEEFIPDATRAGVDFARKVEELKRKIVIQDTNDPELNDTSTN